MTVLHVVANEIASVVTHLARYPTGIGRQWVASGSQSQPGTAKPIVLIPGLADNLSVFTALRRALENNGAGPVVSFGYSPFITDARTAATALAAHVEQLCADTGASRVDLVGHSLGGLIARYYVQCLGGNTRVDTVATVATPHGGTVTAWLLSRLAAALPAGYLRQGGGPITVQDEGLGSAQALQRTPDDRNVGDHHQRHPGPISPPLHPQQDAEPGGRAERHTGQIHEQRAGIRG